MNLEIVLVLVGLHEGRLRREASAVESVPVTVCATAGRGTAIAEHAEHRLFLKSGSQQVDFRFVCFHAVCTSPPGESLDE